MRSRATGNLLGCEARVVGAFAAVVALSASAPSNAAPISFAPSVAGPASPISFAVEPAADDGRGANVFQGATWKDVDGNPLPFQSDAEILEFLRTASIESIDDIPIGVTNPRQVTLEEDGVRMHAALRDYDHVFEEARIDGQFFARLRDSFIFDVPAYALARRLGLDNIPPVTFRRVGGDRVTLQAWLEGGLMETDRIAQEIPPPSFERHRQQTQNMRVFDSIIGNVDRNTGNILTDADGTFWLIDHSRAFMRNDDTRYLERISMCSSQLFERIKGLQREGLLELMSPPLTESEVDWVLRRRDKVVAHIENLIETRPPGTVLFDGAR